jgi:enamine deaminase RidA (YjgF/YER057c/UK114 family)
VDRQLVSSGSPWELVMGYSRAVRTGATIAVSGTAPQWPDGEVDPDIEVQTRRVFEIIGAALAEAGASFADVVRTRIFLVDLADFDCVMRIHGEHFADVRPACTGVIVAGLLDARWKVEIEVDAVVDEDHAPH